VACFRPLSAYRDRQGGEVRLGRRAGEQGDRLELPCGRCIGCRLDRARSWTLRIGHEAMLHDRNLFLTLDYAPEHLRSWSLEYSDYQSFMKRLRKAVGRVRFFVAGEYGARYRRPHFHAILFGCDFKDKRQLVNGTFRSAQAEKLWGNGQVVIADVTPERAAYVAGYTFEKTYGAAADDKYEDLVDVRTGEVFRRRPEFCAMSRRPGIGAGWYDKYGSDLFPHDFAVGGDGNRHKVPRYYWNKFQADAPGEVIEELQHRRFLRAMEVDRVENSERRRADREEVTWAHVLHRAREH